ncbi:MAG: type II toxin-antitoxin system RelE/ParE family toxin [Lutibacter sp.]|jgi:toxin ParE1/3/4|nr:type II toxin-antitoxin system RelE/ParE family toxin [Lutibacter sp.]MDO9594153.1 type II toxin-antitoxin system RelE/ParE family toxin [Lutibacter sp.]MDP2068458.1 type II toxin-antitoxin system RelE/ParE family toxin [Lutibacter sp.]MDP3945383.1 type II toxin-antitoxin system RelE/ParE family toxin [Lutibacter sp.]
MSKYKLSNAAKEDLIRIHHYGVKKFGIVQADKYYDSFFEYFEIIAQRPLSFESVDFIKKGYRRCVCGSDSIYYKINNDIVEIMTIIGRQDLNNIF